MRSSGSSRGTPAAGFSTKPASSSDVSPATLLELQFLIEVWADSAAEPGRSNGWPKTTAGCSTTRPRRRGSRRPSTCPGRAIPSTACSSRTPGCAAGASPLPTAPPQAAGTARAARAVILTQRLKSQIGSHKRGQEVETLLETALQGVVSRANSLADHARRRTVEHRVEQQLERRARLGAEVHLAAHRHDVALADAERDDVRLIAEEILAEQPAALKNRPLRRVPRHDLALDREPGLQPIRLIPSKKIGHAAGMPKATGCAVLNSFCRSDPGQ